MLAAVVMALPSEAAQLSRPANDSFSTPQTITGSSGSTSGSNVGATLQSGEPQHAGVPNGASVWYLWAAPSTGLAAVDTTGSSFNTVLAAYTGSSLTALTAVAGNNDFNGTRQSKVTFNVVKGTTYRIAVAGYKNSTGSVSQGSISLHWSITPPPANDNFANARALTGTSGTVTGTNVAATLESGEPQHAGVAEDASVWYSWQPTDTGNATLTTAGSSFDTVLAVYTGTSIGALTAVASNNDANGTKQSSASFSVTAGVSYLIAVAGYQGATGNVTLGWTWSAPPRPANDNLASAQALNGTSGSTTGTNVNATTEPGEPQHAGVNSGTSVWYAWTPTDGGAATISTAGSSFDTVLAVYTGTAVNALTPVVANDDANGTPQSQVTFTAVAGTTYEIAVAGVGTTTGFASGSIALAWQLAGSQPSSGSNDMFANAQTLTGASGSVSGSNVDATLETGEPQHAGVPNGASVWYAWTASGGGATTISTAGSDFDTVLAVYTGTQLTALTAVAASDDYNSTPQSQVTFSAVAGTTYKIAVAGFNNATFGVRHGTIALAWNGPTPAPVTGVANDLFAKAQTISGATGTVSGTNVGATLETGEPQHGGFPNGASVWYAWTAPGSGTASIGTAGSGFDTVLAVYTGSQLTALTPIASNDDYNGTKQSQVSFDAVAGTVYRIAVAGFNNAQTGVGQGSVSLTWSGPATAPPPSGPANDNFANAQSVSGPSGSVNGSNVGATLETGEPRHAGVSSGASVWYRWQAAASGAATINTSGSSFDTVLAVYTGAQLSTLTAVASSDDYNGTKQSQVSFNAVAGTTYQIAVAGFNSATNGIGTGSVTLTWSGPAAPAGDTTPPSVSLTEPTGSSVTGIVELSASAADTGGIAKVDFLVNGVVVATRTSSPFTSDWDSTTAPNGSVTIAARATDASGNQATTAAKTVTVGNAAPGADPVLLAAGDVASCSSSGDEATALLLGVPGATVAPLGDNAFAGGSASDYANCYDPTWGAVKARTRPVIGNHDYDTAGAAGYFGYFGPSAGDPGKGYYSYDLGTWHVIVLNSNCAQVGGCAAGSPEEQWLKTDLAAHPAQCTIAMWHHPLFSSALYSDATLAAVKPFWQDLYAAGADVVLNAHAHVYDRFAPQSPDGAADPNGVRQFTVATGGESLNPLGTTPPPNLEKNENTAFGVLKLTLHAGGYDWQFLPVAGSTFSDTGSSTCH